jgi:hypothetical protein
VRDTRSRSDASGSSRLSTLITTTFSFQPRCFTAKPLKPDAFVMSSDRVLDYLTEELVVAKNIVCPSCTVEPVLMTDPCHSLPGDVLLSKPCSRNSRKSGQKVCRIPLHFVFTRTRNVLFCSELAVYHSEQAGSSDAGYATYIIGGEPRVSYLDSTRGTDKMAIYDEEMDEDSEDVPETKTTLVREADLESARFLFAPASIIPKPSPIPTFVATLLFWPWPPLIRISMQPLVLSSAPPTTSAVIPSLLTCPRSHSLLWCSALSTGTGWRTLRRMVPN